MIGVGSFNLQIAMSAMQFNDIVSSLYCSTKPQTNAERTEYKRTSSLSSGDEGLLELFNLFDIHFLRRDVLLVKRNRRRRPGICPSTPVDSISTLKTSDRIANASGGAVLIFNGIGGGLIKPSISQGA